MRRIVPLAAAALVLSALPAHAATAVVHYRHNDGSREAGVHLDAAEGVRWAMVRMDIHARHLEALEYASLYVSMRSDRCDAPDPSYDRLVVNETVVTTFDPCRKVSSERFGSVGFNVPTALLRAGENTFRLEDADATGTHTAHLAVDTDNSGHSTANGAVAGELMWDLHLKGEIPMMWITPYECQCIVVYPVFWFGNHDVGTSVHQRSLYVLYHGPEPFPIVSLGISGPDAEDFALTADGCTGVAMRHTANCPFAVSFTPGAVGPRRATLTITGEDGVTSTATLKGYGRVGPPVSRITTSDGSVLLPLDTVIGTVTDDGNVAREYVRFSSGTQSTTVQAVLDCDAARTACDWAAEVPVGLPGPYTVTAWGVDSHENDERPGPSISVVVL